MYQSLGAIKSPEDYRDVVLADILPEVKLPDEYFVDVEKLPIWNQKHIGSCVGHAGAKYKQIMEQTENVIPFSPRFLYALAKCKDGYGGQGTYPRVMMKVMQDYGCATEKTVPNNCDLDHEKYVFDRNPKNIPIESFEEAKPYKIKSYANVGLSCEELKQAIYQSNGCILLVDLDKKWWIGDNLSPLQPPTNSDLRHEVYLYGYKTVAGITKFFLINSWGENWCDKGKGWFIYEQYKKHLVEAITAVDLPNNLIEELKTLPKPNEFKYNFQSNLIYKQKGDEVKKLQIALKIDGCFPKTVKETGYYGDITRQAVKKFQSKYKVANWIELSFVNGKRVGLKTRNKLNSLFNK